MSALRAAGWTRRCPTSEGDQRAQRFWARGKSINALSINPSKSMRPYRIFTHSLFAAVVGSMPAWALAIEPASEADRTFVAQVSQGGQYEVEAGKVAAQRGGAPVIKNLGVFESHDHDGVGRSLKQIAAQTHVPFHTGLNPEFAQRLAKLKAVPADQFDAYYVTDMKQIHDKDEGLFVKEADEGSPAYKTFAHQTAVLVKAHLGWLGTL